MTEQLSFVLPWPPSMNHYWRRVGNKTLISKDGRNYRVNVHAALHQYSGSFGTSRVQVYIAAYPPDRRRRDLDNLFKPLLDAIAHAGVMLDDSQIDDLRIKRCECRPDGELEVFIERIG